MDKSIASKFLKNYIFTDVSFTFINVIVNILVGMPKTKYLSTPEKYAIVTAKELDKTDRDVAKLFNVNQSTVSRVYNRYKKTNDIHRKPKSGRP